MTFTQAVLMVAVPIYAQVVLCFLSGVTLLITTGSFFKALSVWKSSEPRFLDPVQYQAHLERQGCRIIGGKLTLPSAEGKNVA